MNGRSTIGSCGAILNLCDEAPAMKVGILQADSVLPQFQARHGNYPDMIIDVLNRAARELDIPLECVTYDVEHGHYPEQISECHGYVISGSRESVYDDTPWIRAFGAYVQRLHGAQARLVGLCFGHQLIAHYLGGKASPAEAGWGVGIQRCKVVHHAGFMEPALDDYALVVSHRDQVVQLPEGAKLLAASDFCPYSMFCLGDHILALQGHPEFDQAYAMELISYRREILGQELYQAGVASLSGSLSRDVIARWVIQFLQ